MQADSTRCPRCVANITDTIKSLEKELADSYGKVSLEMYKGIINKKLKYHESLLEQEEKTLREYYEIGMYEEKFSISYRAHCGACGFEYNYNVENIDPLIPTPNEICNCEVYEYIHDKVTLLLNPTCPVHRKEP